MSTDTLEQSFATARSMLAGVRPDQWDSPTPSASWDVRALVNHIVGGAYGAAQAVTDGRASAGAPVDYTRGDVVARYDEATARTLAAFRAPGVDEKMVEMPFGTLPAGILRTIFSTDAFTHAWDLARATGQDTNLAPNLAAELLDSARGFLSPELRGSDGIAPFGPEQTAPAGSSAADHLVAFLGRKV